MLVNLLLVTSILLVIYYVVKTPRRLNIPGPWGLPVLGNLLRLNPTHPHLRLSEWAKQYEGGAYSLRLFGENYLVLNSYELIKEALVDRVNDFAGRPQGIHRIDLGTFNHSEMMYQNPDDPTWRLARDTVQQTVGQQEGSGQAKDIYAKMTKDLINKLWPLKKSAAENRHECRSDINTYVVRMMLYLTLGKVIDEENKIFSRISEMERLYATAMNMAGEGSELDAFPFLSLINNSTYKKIMRGKGLAVLLWEQVSQDLKKTPNAVRPESIMQRLSEVQQTAKDGTGRPVLKDLNLMCNMASLQITGISTLVNTMYAAVNILTHYPDVQRKMHQEIDNVIGDQRLPEPEDHAKMPYSMAAVYELLRYTSIMPLAVPRAATKDTYIAECFVPKSTTVLANVWELHHDVLFWGDPWVYRPERFLDLKGNLLPPDDENRKHLLAFGGGLRMCPALDWALGRVFVFMVSMMQTYEIKFAPVPGIIFPSCDPRTYELGQVLYPKRAQHRFILRGCQEDAG